MTYEEAINCIDDVLNSDYHYDESLGYQLTSDDFEWLEKSKKALEKQIPKKPRIDADEWTCCPECDSTFKIFDSFNKRNRYCGNCGQALDWSDHPTEKGGEQE
jgi:hypothetical protein